MGMSADSQKRRHDVGRGASYDAKDGGRRCGGNAIAQYPGSGGQIASHTG